MLGGIRVNGQMEGEGERVENVAWQVVQFSVRTRGDHSREDAGQLRVRSADCSANLAAGAQVLLRR